MSLKSTPKVQLRDITEDDLPTFFEQQRDPVSNHMAAFTAKDPTDRDAFMAHWTKILTDEAVLNQTILYEGQVAGHVSQFEMFGEPEISYWIGREFWSKGIATAALSAFLPMIPIRPLFARAVSDNLGSRRVLEKCGFVTVGTNLDFANARGEDVEEVILKLNGHRDEKERR